MAKIKQTKVSVSSFADAIVGSKPLSTEQQNSLAIHNRLALERLLNRGCAGDFEILAGTSNLAEVIDADYFHGKMREKIHTLQDDMLSAYVTAKAKGVYVLTSQGITAIKNLLDIHEAQLANITQSEMRKATSKTIKMQRDEYKQRAKK